MAEVVRPELQLESLRGRETSGRRHHTRVVDQHVDRVVSCADVCRESAHRVEIREVEQDGFDACGREGSAQPAGGGIATRLVPASHDHSGSVGDERLGGLEPEPAVGTGHHGDAACLVGHLCWRPMPHDAVLHNEFACRGILVKASVVGLAHFSAGASSARMSRKASSVSALSVSRRTAMSRVWRPRAR